LYSAAFDVLIALHCAANCRLAGKDLRAVPVNNLYQSTPLNPLALIVEDDDALAAIYQEALRQVHFKSIVVSDGAVAMTQVQALAPALVILDLHLPHVSGIDILRQIRQDPALASIHVIVTTADSVRAATVQDQADLVMIKPVSVVQLRDIARRIRSTMA
jgi:two-component system cell cycle response regulator DivK